MKLYGFEAGGSGVATGLHAASITGGSVGVLHGTRTFLLQDEYGQTKDSHSISAGLDYPAVGPEHAWLHATGRAVYEPVDDSEAMDAFRVLCQTEGIIPAIESAHALAGALRIAPQLAAELGREPVIVVNLSGRGDKDMHTAAAYFGVSFADDGHGEGRAVNRLQDVLKSARAENRAVLIGYLPAGYPSVDGSIEAMRAMVEGGCDIIEVGLPYSDPAMDGPVIQAAADQALSRGVTTPDVIRAAGAVARHRRGGADHVVLEPDRALRGRALRRASWPRSAAAGVITPDLIPEEAGPWIAATDAHDLGRVFLVAPSSTPERIALTQQVCSGFVYAGAVMGVTGARDQVGHAARELVERTKKATDQAVCVGLGVSTGEQAAEIAGYADGVIVGSAFVRRLLDNRDPRKGVDAVRELAAELADGVRRGSKAR